MKSDIEIPLSLTSDTNYLELTWLINGLLVNGLYWLDASGQLHCHIEGILQYLVEWKV
jgi:hypothetical protein